MAIHSVLIIISLLVFVLSCSSNMEINVGTLIIGLTGFSLWCCFTFSRIYIVYKSPEKTNLDQEKTATYVFTTVSKSHRK